VEVRRRFGVVFENMKFMLISGVIFTHHLPEEALPWITEARSVFDETVIFIEEKRFTPGTVTRAQKVGTRVVRYKADKWYDADCRSLLAGCESDWLFLLDYDEQLSPEWQQDQWRQILETTQFTHFWVPRRWTAPSGRYINCGPWWPDFQLRLFRNNLEGTTLPTRLHDVIRVPGPGASFQNLTLYHHVLWLCPRKVREDKVRYYEQVRPGEGLGHYYLYEDHAPSEAALPATEKLEVNREILRMNRLSPEDMSNISLKVNSVPKAVRISEWFWLDAKVINETSENLHPHPPLGVYLAYHWIYKINRRMAMFEGHRTGLFPFAPANTTIDWRMSVMAPNEPGEYILQITMIQEGVGWFENIRPGILQEFAVLVKSEKEGASELLSSPVTKRVQTSV
jgi:hypothetical protein